MNSRVLVTTPATQFIPPDLNSRLPKKPVAHLANFHVLDKSTKRTLLDRDKVLTTNRKCMEELQARLAAVQVRVLFLFRKK